jgi:hypothetical protein
MSDAMTSAGAPHVFRLMYRSRNVIPPEQRKQELGPLFTAARANNKRQDITGALLVFQDWFVQVLEGDEQAVLTLLGAIERDPRHRDVTLLETRPAVARVFARWAMARVSEDGERDIPLIAHTDGIAPAAGRPTTPEQDQLLAEMREAARAAPQTV